MLVEHNGGVITLMEKNGTENSTRKTH